MLHAEALLVVDVSLSIFDLHGHVDVGVDELLAFGDVHLFDLSHVSCHVLD